MLKPPSFCSTPVVLICLQLLPWPTRRPRRAVRITILPLLAPVGCSLTEALCLPLASPRVPFNCVAGCQHCYCRRKLLLCCRTSHRQRFCYFPEHRCCVSHCGSHRLCRKRRQCHCFGIGHSSGGRGKGAGMGCEETQLLLQGRGETILASFCSLLSSCRPRPWLRPPPRQVLSAQCSQPPQPAMPRLRLTLHLRPSLTPCPLLQTYAAAFASLKSCLAPAAPAPAPAALQCVTLPNTNLDGNVVQSTTASDAGDCCNKW